jgi:hypothetical protein
MQVLYSVPHLQDKYGVLFNKTVGPENEEPPHICLCDFEHPRNRVAPARFAYDERLPGESLDKRRTVW